MILQASPASTTPPGRGKPANPDNDDKGGLYIERSLKLLEKDMVEAAEQLDDALFVEYWGEGVPKKERIARWLKKADEIAVGWKPSARRRPRRRQPAT